MNKEESGKSIFYEELAKMGEIKYKEFNAKLVPGVEKDSIIGIRVPMLRKFAKQIYDDRKEECKEFLEDLPHYYLEENTLHGLIIENMKDIEEALMQTDKFLPYVDNWQTCDIFNPKVFKKNKEKVLGKVREWLGASECYVVRYAIGLLLSNYLDDDFKPEYLKLAVGISSEEYYVKMMVAWYFSTALAKQYESAIKVIECEELDTWTHNKTIQKALESYRVSAEKKEYLRGLKVKI